MKLVIRTLFFHFLCIIIFSLLYFYYKDNFVNNTKKEFDIIDSIFLTTTIQSGVGMSNINPNNSTSKLLMITQQMLLIMTHVVTIYIFTI